MKKEIIVGCFLGLLIAAALVNTHYLNKLTDNVTRLIEKSEQSAEKNDWDEAAEKAEEAARLWSGSNTYTHLVLRHAEIEAATDAIYDFIEQIYAREPENAAGTAQGAVSRLKSISSIEQIKLGSIF